VRTRVGLKLGEFTVWTQCEETYEDELDKVQVLPPGKRGETDAVSIEANRKIMRALQSQYTQKEEKSAIAMEVKWREEGFEQRVLNPRLVSLLGEARRLKLALQCWALGWVNEVEDREKRGMWHWDLQVPGWDLAYWITPNTDNKGERDDFEALQAFVLWGINHARDHRNTPLDWEALEAALEEQHVTPAEGSDSPLKVAVQKALDKDGLIGRWQKIAGEHIDKETDRRVYDNPAYHDLADYANRYFRSQVW
jgi:hypothetical protein